MQRNKAIALSTAQMVEVRYPVIVALHDLENGINRTARSMREMFLITNAKALDEELKGVIKARELTDADFKKLQSVMTSQSVQAALTKLLAANAKYRAMQDKFLALVGDSNMQEAKGMMLVDIPDPQDATFVALQELIKLQEGLIQESRDDIQHALSAANASAALFTGVGLAFSVLKGFWSAVTTHLHSADSTPPKCRAQR